MAYALHTRRCMNADCIGWRRLTPDAIADVPEESAVFEVANLVRNVQYIGSARGNLRATLATFALEQTLPAIPGGHFFRYHGTEDEDQAVSTRLAAYRAEHLGKLPIGNAQPLPTLRVAARRAA